MSPAADEFVARHPRSVLITHRGDGGLQASPVRVLRDDDGRIVATSRATTAKVRNIARDPRVALCVLDDAWQGPWMTIEGEAEILGMPGALSQLAAFYRQRDGSLPEAAEFQATMEAEERVLLVIHSRREAGTALR